MPYDIRRGGEGCKGGYEVFGPHGSHGCHTSRSKAIQQQRALYAAENAKKAETPNFIKVDWTEGMMVRGMTFNGLVMGRVEHVMKNGMLGSPQSDFKIEASENDPALLIRIFAEEDGALQETEYFVGVKSSSAEVIQDMQVKYDNSEDMQKMSLQDLDLVPTESMANNAKRGLELRRKFGRGGTAVGVARARDLSNKTKLSPDTVLRMYSFFSRHEVDKQGKDWNNAEKPSNGKIAWLLWGGDSGYAWSTSKRNAIMRIRSQKSDGIWIDSPFTLQKYIDKTDFNL
jgi:hypothetical protein